MSNSLTAAAAPARRSVHFLGNILNFRARAEDTAGAFSLADCRSAPGAGSPYHKQADTEAFLVLEGRFEFILDGRSSVHGPGAVIHIPPGTPHSFRNCEESPGRVLIINLPAGPHENFFDEVGEPLSGDGDQAFPPPSAPDFGLIAAAAERHGIEILPPAG